MQRENRIQFLQLGKGLERQIQKGRKVIMYPREGSITVLVVVGNKEKPLVEAILPDCTVEMQNIYHQTQEGNGQRWLMVDLADRDDLYDDVLRFIGIRRT